MAEQTSDQSNLFPIRTKTFVVKINDLPTQCSISVYADRIVVILSQVGTLGTIIHAHKETVLGGGLTYQITTLLGPRDNAVPELCARQLIEKLSETGSEQDLLLCLGLAGGNRRSDVGDVGDPQLIKSIIDSVMDNRVW